MEHRNRLAWLALVMLAMIAFSTTWSVAAADNDGTVAALQAAIAGPQRSETNKARDQYRHPLQTLTFFGIKPDMTVVEIWPGNGWYTEILAPFLKNHGKLYEALGGGTGAKTFEEKLKANQAVYGAVIVTELQPPAQTEIAPAGTADMVLTFRNVHDWLSRGNTEDYFKAFYRALKPGGILGLTDHRADPSQPQDLPPTLRQGQKDRAKYLAIGESDRMTLKFVKPAAEAQTK
jgi:predicted methyltransferase